jgi:signal transduction histidine kinase
VAPLSVEVSEELAQLGLVVERLPTGVILVTSGGLEVKYANLSAQRLLHPAKLRVGHPLPDPWESFSLRSYALDLIKRKVAVERRVEMSSGHVYLVNGMTFDRKNRAAMLLRDVTENARRGRAEREFIANASHELLTPLTGIVAAAHVLEAGGKEVPEERDRFIAHIATECNRLARIARSLLVLARAQSGEEPPRLEIIALRPVLDEILERIDAEVGIRCAKNLTVLADADLLTQALTNLIANAVRHGPTGDIDVDVRDIDDHLVEIDILAASAREPALAEFRGRFRSADGRDGGGFGLGLAIAEQSLRVMGGQLLLDGSAVRVQIPRGGLAPR